MTPTARPSAYADVLVGGFLARPNCDGVRCVRMGLLLGSGFGGGRLSSPATGAGWSSRLIPRPAFAGNRLIEAAGPRSEEWWIARSYSADSGPEASQACWASLSVSGGIARPSVVPDGQMTMPGCAAACELAGACDRKNPGWLEPLTVEPS
jgi:hypothetical protein